MSLDDNYISCPKCGFRVFAPLRPGRSRSPMDMATFLRICRDQTDGLTCPTLSAELAKPRRAKR